MYVVVNTYFLSSILLLGICSTDILVPVYNDMFQDIYGSICENLEKPKLISITRDPQGTIE